MQLYREEAVYLDRVWKWVEKTGLDRIRGIIMEDHEARRALYQRFLVSQRFVRMDPWAERAAGFHAQEFAPLAIVAPIAAE
jgi:nitrite reductase (NADH) large subunit